MACEMDLLLDTLIKQEVDPSLGNPDLAVYGVSVFDSMAHEGMGRSAMVCVTSTDCSAKIEDGRQVECTDNWLEGGFPWEPAKTGRCYGSFRWGNRHQDETAGSVYPRGRRECSCRSLRRAHCRLRVENR